jgi:hypothetical protein
MEPQITKKQLKIILKIVLKSRRSFESLMKESGIADIVDFPTQLTYEQADIIIKTHSGFLV